MASKIDLNRRNLLSTSGAALALIAVPVAAPSVLAAATVKAVHQRMISAEQFGAVGDGTKDDTGALQAALDATINSNDAQILVIPPGVYKISHTLSVTMGANQGHHSGIVGYGARLHSAIEDDSNVLEVKSDAYVRFVLLEGLDILGSGKDGHGLYLECDSGEKALYNLCLRDVVVQGCGADGCRMLGNVFEGQVINSYFRNNRGNGITFAHGYHGGILSSIHVFGCVLGENGQHGAALVHNCYDVAFHGCYFLLNGKFGLVAENGSTLLSNCGFENNHQQAGKFEAGGAGIDLSNFGTLVGCTAYSIMNQTHLIHAHVVGQLVMIGCSGSGDGPAKGAGLARLQGGNAAKATIIGCSGAIEYGDGFDGLELGGRAGGVRFGDSWRSRNLPQLGEYRLWVDGQGRLRLKKGVPNGDDDGAPVGT